MGRGVELGVLVRCGLEHGGNLSAVDLKLVK